MSQKSGANVGAGGAGATRTPGVLQAVPVLKDNYAWIVAGPTGGALVVDPGEAEPVRAALARRGLRLGAILVTHHHADHVGGVAQLAATSPGVAVVASAYDAERCRTPSVTQAVADHDAWRAAGLDVEVHAVPGHTLGAVAYHLPAIDAVFTGDTLFLAGCGRLFEGEPATMWQSLRRLRALPDATRVCCGHDYLGKNLRFVQSLGGHQHDTSANEVPRGGGDVEATADARDPWATLALERRRNPFLRADDPALQRTLGAIDAVETFAELRRRRDAFR